MPVKFDVVGITPRDQAMASAAPKHSPRFTIDESGLLHDTRSLAALAIAFISGSWGLGFGVWALMP